MANTEAPGPTFKFLFIGDAGVGKSSILKRFIDDDFDEGETCTIGVDFKTKQYELDDKKMVLNIWDTAGQEKFRSLTSSYYRGAHGVILVYDISKAESFQNINQWLNEVEMYSTRSNLVKLLVGNKIDKEDRRAVPKEKAIDFARQKAMMYIECSAKTSTGVQQTFEELVRKILDTPELYAVQSSVGEQCDIGATTNDGYEGGGWCC